MVKGTRIPIEGSVVTLVNEKGQEIRRGSTDVNGQVIFQDLSPVRTRSSTLLAPTAIPWKSLPRPSWLSATSPATRC